MLGNIKEMLLTAQKNGYAVGAFNIENMETAQAVISAAEELNSPVILQTTPSTIRYGGIKLFRQMLASLAEDAKIPAAVHLDHGSDFELAVKAVHAGYTSVMIDGSQLDFEANTALTKRVAEFCGAVNIPVEAELGKVGGKEDDTESSGSCYTHPGEAAEFVKRTGIFSLAVGIGTSHGIYTGAPKINTDLVSDISKKIENPLVLHGTSGLPDTDVCECIKRGICKVNYATELRLAFTEGVREALTADPAAFDPKFYLGAGREKVKRAVKRCIEVCRLYK
ncbi:MAG: class II fructose-bisphosphate aldolase [Oscillospiraceae bacterium]|nr:class II fructose-bisphosphate aldolase [Oscillospiraceae bacterium]